MEHNHDYEKSTSLKNLVFAIMINGVIVVFEMVLGLIIQSMALISDAIHNLSDIAAMIFSYWAEKLSRRPANARMTYGYRKIRFIAAFVNSIVLSVAIAFVLWEAVGRLAAPPEIPGKAMLLVAVVAFLGNGSATLFLQKLSARNVNMKTAWLHSFQDALFSLGVILGALLITFFGWSIIDPIISIVISLFIVRAIYVIIRRTVNALMDAVPPGIDFMEVKKELLAIDDVAEVKDLHIWQTGEDQNLLSAHIRMAEGSGNGENIIRKAQEVLLRSFGINHATIQILPFSADEMEHCNHCN